MHDCWQQVYTSYVIFVMPDYWQQQVYISNVIFVMPDYWQQQVYISYVIFVMAWVLTSVHLILHLCHGMIIDNKCTLHMSSLSWLDYLKPNSTGGGGDCDLWPLPPTPPPGECQYPHSNHLHNYSGEMDCNDLSPLPPATDRHTHTVMGGEIFSPPPPPLCSLPFKRARTVSDDYPHSNHLQNYSG